MESVHPAFPIERGFEVQVFVAQAHSITQQARLAVTLAWVAGYTNIIALMACGQVTSHVSGTTSNLGKALAEGSWPLVWTGVFLLLTFMVGAMISGVSTEWARRKGRESIYVIPMAIEGVLLAGFAIGVELKEHGLADGAPLYLMAGLASAAMGLQNATITRISSGVVRTTHVTGVLTDLGMEIVQFLWWLRDRHKDVPPGTLRQLVRGLRAHPTSQRLGLLASIIGSFAFGATLGTWIYDHLPRWAMFPPVLFLIWIVYQDITRPIAAIEASDLFTENGALGLPGAIGVFHLRHDRLKAGRNHRMPNLLAWSERLPERVKVVVLDLGDVTELRGDAAYELRAVVARLRQQRRAMVIAGLTPEQYRQLQQAGAAEPLDPASVCPDLELAIARAMNLLGSVGGRFATAAAAEAVLK